MFKPSKGQRTRSLVLLILKKHMPREARVHVFKESTILNLHLKDPRSQSDRKQGSYCVFVETVPMVSGDITVYSLQDKRNTNQGVVISYVRKGGTKCKVMSPRVRGVGTVSRVRFPSRRSDIKWSRELGEIGWRILVSRNFHESLTKEKG